MLLVPGVGWPGESSPLKVQAVFGAQGLEAAHSLGHHFRTYAVARGYSDAGSLGH